MTKEPTSTPPIPDNSNTDRQPWTETKADRQHCTWIEGDDPCTYCPRKITALHMCKLLQDISERKDST